MIAVNFFQMEMTRIQWSKSFGCGIPARDLRLVWSITAGFVILIILFYGGVYLCGVLEEKKEKRIYSGKGDGNLQGLVNSKSLAIFRSNAWKPRSDDPKLTGCTCIVQFIEERIIY